ncbi:MAG TPA: ABC transporter substrate-binding protein [Stellaceae bacterium]|nr:ABC transporter substrate-binding protein [Stellaceae bacterium]
MRNGSGLLRRQLFAFLGTVAAAPRLALAQQSGGTKRIGVLMPTAENDPEVSDLGAVFRQALQELGWVGGRNLRIDYRWGGGDPRRIATLAQQMVVTSPDAILAGGAPVVAPLKRATSTIPIVFISASDPVGQGFVRTLARPGGNITGFSNFEPGMGAKWIALLKQMVPGLARVGVLYNPATAPYVPAFLHSVEAGASTLGVAVQDVALHEDGDIDPAMAALARKGAGGILLPSDVFTLNHASTIVTLANQYRLPAIYAFRVIALQGGLVSWSVDLGEQMRLAAKYIDRILSGTAPGDLPVLLPSRFSLVINKKTAAALGLELTPAILAQADEVIE